MRDGVNGLQPPFPAFSVAFQPIVHAGARRVVSWEALVRGVDGASAAAVLGQVPAQQLYAFDEAIRGRAIAFACRLGIGCELNLNFLPRSLCASTEALGETMDAARQNNFPLERIVLEVSETEVIDDQITFVERINGLRSLGLKVAIDDFGAGHSGLNLLADFQPDQVKLDMKLVRGIEGHGPRQAIVRGICQTCTDLAIDVVAEGVETMEEYGWLQGEGIDLFQGYLFAKPALERLPPVRFPNVVCRV